MTNIQQRIIFSGLSQKQLSHLCNLRENDLCDWLRGNRIMPQDIFRRVHEALADIDELKKLAAPFPLDTRNVVLIKNLISRMHDGEFAARDSQQSSAVPA